MFTAYQDYTVADAHIPVLTLQKNGQYEFRDCYFLEFVVKPDYETCQKIRMVCEPFDFIESVQYSISRYNFFRKDRELRLFLLAAPDTIRHDFHMIDDLLAFAMCLDGEQKTKILYFEVNYKFRHSYEPTQKYRRVGTSALDALKEVYKNRELYGRSAIHALKFWLKNDFTPFDDRELYLHWVQR